MRGAGGCWVGVFSLLAGALALPACGRPLDADAHRPDGGMPHPGGTRDATLAPDAGPFDGSARDGGAGNGRATDGGSGGGRSADGGAGSGRAADGASGSGRPADGGSPDAGRPTMAVCPDVGDFSPLPPWEAPLVPTALPFSCNPMPRRLILPAPPAAAEPFLIKTGSYSRCATFSLGAAQALALSPDGRFAATVNGDGVARVVEIASQQVVALLAPPRARVSRVAFSPDGRWVATVAGGEHELDVYATSTWALSWTSILPGTPYGYTDGSAGAIAFTPDSERLLVSPGANLYLTNFDGQVISSYGSAAVLDVAYAWNGQRVVVADAFLTGSCSKSPDGGRVVVLDPSNLLKLATVGSWDGYATDNVVPAFRASPTDDLVFVPPSTLDPNQAVHAFKLSDGTELPRPTMTAWPAAFLPDGNLLFAGGGELGIQPVGGATVAQVAAPTPARPVVAVSADGGTVGVGGDGADLLRVWHVADDFALGVCTLDDAAAGLMSISADGSVVALGVGGKVEVVRSNDGTIIGAVNGNGQPFQRLTLSRSGRFVAAVEYAAPVPVEDLPTPAIDYLQIIAVPGNGLVADLSKRAASHAGYLFSPDETTFYDTWFPSGGVTAGTLETIDLASGKVIATRSVPVGTRPIGFSRGCPVLLDPSRGAYRSCESCDEPAIPAVDALVSPNGRALLTRDPSPARTTTLWSLPGGEMLHVFGPPAGLDPSWTVDALPVAASAGAGNVLIGAGVEASCYDGPAFPTLLEDQSGDVLATLPPGGAPASEDLARLTFRGELWCSF